MTVDPDARRAARVGGGLPLGELGGIGYEAIEAQYVLADLAEL